MSTAIVCHGCGARLTVPEDYPRNKMQCPECGVMCPVPPPAARKKTETPAPVEEAALPDDDEPAEPARAAAPPAKPKPATAIVKEAAPAGKGLANCPHCGELVRMPGRKRGRREPCPACGEDWPEAPPRKKAAPPPLPVEPPPDEFAGSTPDEDPETSNPYRTADPGARRCPGCSDLLGPDVVFCTRCGFDLRTGRKVVKEYRKFERSWDSGMPPVTRWVVFLVCQGIALLAIGAGFLTLEDEPAIAVPTFGFSWLIYTAMTAFLLGTYDHVYLKRYKSGKVDLVKTWRLAFIPFPPRDIDLHAYFGVVGGREAGVGVWEWTICIFLLLSGIVPAVIWWYCTIYKIVYYVCLTNEHGAPEETVYRGWSEQQMLDIQEALRDALTV